MTTPGVVRRTIDEHVIPGMRLGRHVEHDPRSWDYQAETAPAIVSVEHAAFGLPLDQGLKGKCTAEALAGAVNCQPNYTGPLALPHSMRGHPATDADTDILYDREVADEGYPPGSDPGGTGNAVCKAARELGWLGRWAWAFSFDSALRALVLRPAILGANWYDSMDQPDGNGVVTISPNAAVRGGHEIVASVIHTEPQMVGFWNSWSASWGLGGRFWMSFATVERLLGEQGDFKVPGAAVAR